MKIYKIYMRNAQGQYIVGWDDFPRLCFMEGKLQGFYTYRIKKFGIFTEYMASWEQTKWLCDKYINNEQEEEVFI